MALIQNELKINKLKELLDMNLALPSYKFIRHITMPDECPSFSCLLTVGSFFWRERRSPSREADRPHRSGR